MRRRELAKELGERRGYGRFVRVASPAYVVGLPFFSPQGLLVIGFGIAEFFRAAHDSFHYTMNVLYLVCGLGMLAAVAVPWFGRRDGGRAPRLYCFTEGVVVAVETRLTPYRWNELAIATEKWETGSGENYNHGWRTTVTSRADGAVVAAFTGLESDLAGAYDMTHLHRAALEREPADE